MPPPDDILPLVRHFAENGFKFLLRQGANLRDLMLMLEPPLVQRIDFAQAQVQPGTFIAPDFRHLESDLLVRAPLRGRREAAPVDVYVLVEHQSEPDDLVVYRALRYEIQVYEGQLRDWLRTHDNARGFAFHPVLPVVFYTGTRSWKRLKEFHELVKQGATFRERLPSLGPMFFNLAGKSAQELREGGGSLGWVLHLVQQRRSGEGQFRGLLEETVQAVGKLPRAQEQRWRDLLWYLHALVYHERGQGEREECAELIRANVRKATRLEEVRDMGKTIAEALREEGKEEGRIETKQESLMRLLTGKFGSVPERIEAEIRSTQDLARLDRWFDDAIAARKLSDISFGPHP
jgi:predicted transposase YdaD